MTDALYKDEAIIRSITYSTRNGYRASFEMDPAGWEALKGMETTRCMMVLVPIDNNQEAAQPPSKRPRKRFRDMPRSQQAGILCKDARFQLFMDATGVDDAALAVVMCCDVDSRTELDTNAEAAAKWGQLLTEYEASIGRIAGEE